MRVEQKGIGAEFAEAAEKRENGIEASVRGRPQQFEHTRF